MYLIFIVCFIGCKAEQENPGIFSLKWKDSSPKERYELADPFKMYELIKGKTKKGIMSYLGEPDSIDNFGDYIYLLGKNKSGELVYDLTCTVAFDGGSRVKRVEVFKP